MKPITENTIEQSSIEILQSLGNSTKSLSVDDENAAYVKPIHAYLVTPGTASELNPLTSGSHGCAEDRYEDLLESIGVETTTY
jgi:hypothetical protein